MPEREHIIRVVQEWVLKAEHDWLTASHLLGLKADYALAAVHFHAQQSAEKYLKSLLVLHSLPVPKTHDIQRLIALVPAEDSPELPIEDMQLLTTFAVEIRYPGPTPADHAEAMAALVVARKIREHVRARLPLGEFDCRT
jgi:HEPN domain-containing protein